MGADLVAIPAISSQYGGYLPEALDAVRKAADSGSIILTVCSGAFLAGAAGLLDGRPCTTHWMHADDLARMYPTAKVDRNVLFVDDGNLITSAGTAAGIDACLHLVRRELGSEVTNTIARRMVVPPQRDGGQRQYIDQPIPVRCSEGFAPHLDWVLSNLDKPADAVATLARRVNMSARTFARRFVEETGRTPMQWVTDQRVLYARRLLEETDLDIDQDCRPIRFRYRNAAAPPFPKDHRCDAVGLPPPVRCAGDVETRRDRLSRYRFATGRRCGLSPPRLTGYVASVQSNVSRRNVLKYAAAAPVFLGVPALAASLTAPGAGAAPGWQARSSSSIPGTTAPTTRRSTGRCPPAVAAQRNARPRERPPMPAIPSTPSTGKWYC